MRVKNFKNNLTFILRDDQNDKNQNFLMTDVLQPDLIYCAPSSSAVSMFPCS